MSFSRSTSDQVRGASVSLVAPILERSLAFKARLLNPQRKAPLEKLSKKEKISQLEVENQMLVSELAHLNALLREQNQLTSHIQEIAEFSPDQAQEYALNNEKTLERTLNILKYRSEAIPARVIFRSFDSWNNTLWINVGDSLNESSQKKIIAKNSPVVLGRGIVGVIDYVGKNQSRVLLITNDRVHPSVRASRGGEQERILSDYVNGLLHYLSFNITFPMLNEQQKHLKELLQEIKQQLCPSKASEYLAKGELCGTINVFRGSRQTLLQGVGFNYDFSDQEGKNRDLRSGKSNEKQQTSTQILKVHDVLVTTGCDGIFPPGFQVGIVTQVDMLKEGDYYYNLKCIPVVKSLTDLTIVFVLPPVTTDDREFYTNSFK